MILDKLKAYGFMALAGVLAVLLGLQTWRLHTAEITLATNLVSIANLKTKAATDLAGAEKKHRQIEQDLNTSAAHTRKVTNEKLLVLVTRHTTLLERVRLAEARAAYAAHMSESGTAPGDGAAVSRDPGAELLGSFGTTDVEEATRAETIRLHLKACYADYNRVAEALKR